MATLLETASLVMVPSGYEDGTLGSLVPTDASGDFTFTRGSNLSATRVNEDGVIEKGYENLLLQSNSFDTTWIPRDATITGGQAGYDGTNDAWLLQAVSNGYNRRIYQSVSLSSVFTFSFYAKANTSNYAQAIVFNSTGADPKSYFNLSTGETGTTTDSIDVNMVDAGDGWYRCSITGNASVSQIWLLVSDYGYTNLVDAGGSIYIQDAQLNQGLVSYPYIETTATPEKGGILADLPRIDYSSGRASLLLEPQRTNVLGQSELLSSDIYSFSRISVNNNSILSPENKLNASKLIVSGSGITRLFKATGGSGSQVVSIFAKAGEMNAISISSYTGTAYLYAMYNLTNGTLINSNADDTGIEDMGDGWYRVWVYVATSTARYAHISIGQSTDSPSHYINTTGNGVDGIYAYGFQAEQDATYPASYIPTYGTSQTRLADAATNTVAIDADNDFTFYFECDKTPDNAGRYVNFSGNLGYLSSYTSSRIRWRYANSNLQSPVSEGTFKFLLRKDSTDIKMYVNGELEHTMVVPSGLQSFDLIQGAVHKILLFPTALSDQACIELTTL